MTSVKRHICLLNVWLFLATFQVLAAPHVHGQAKMTVVLDHHRLILTAVIPAHDLVGFEHMAQSADEKSRVDSAVKQLKQTHLWLHLKSGECKLKSSHVSNPLLEADDASGAHVHDDESENHEHHTSHGDFEVSVEMECKQFEDIEVLDVMLHHLFQNIQVIEVQWIVNGNQGLSNLNNQHKTVRFK